MMTMHLKILILIRSNMVYALYLFVNPGFFFLCVGVLCINQGAEVAAMNIKLGQFCFEIILVFLVLGIVCFLTKEYCF